MAQPKKENPRILSSDVYAYISNNSTLNREQVRECFDTYYKMICGILESDYRFNDITIAFPKIGNFYFNECKGRKKGSTYKMPIDFGTEMRVVTLENDEPNYFKMKLKVSDKLNFILKCKSGRKK